MPWCRGRSGGWSVRTLSRIGASRFLSGLIRDEGAALVAAGSSRPASTAIPAALSDVLSALGLTVEEMTVTGSMPGGVVLGRVLDLRPHPDADRIQLVDVDDGSGSDPAGVLRGLQHGGRRPGPAGPGGDGDAQRAGDRPPQAERTDLRGHVLLGDRARHGRRRRGHHDPQRPGRRRRRSRARRWPRPSAWSPTCCGTSTSAPTGPTPCRSWAWPATSRPAWAWPSSPPTGRHPPRAPTSRRPSTWRSSTPRCAAASSAGCCATLQPGLVARRGWPTG